MTTHVLLDFFGTLVDYSASRTEQGYERSFALLQAAGCRLDYQAFLSLWSEVFLEFDKTGIVAQGHTDSTGSDTYNLELSERRAGAVMLHLVHEGIDSTRIAAIGFGESYPIANNDSDDGRRQNRRVDLMLRAKAR